MISNQIDLTDLVGEADSPIPAILAEAELASLLGISGARVRGLCRDGILHRAGRGRFDARRCLRDYLANLREHAARAGRPTAGGSNSLKVAKVKLAEEQAVKIEMQNQVMRRDLVPASEVAFEWSSILRDVRAGMLAVPSRVSVRLGHLTAHDLSEITLEIRDVLSEMAGTDAND